MTFTPSYSILLENYSFGLGLSNFSGGKANIFGCPSYHACYDDMVDITHVNIPHILTLQIPVPTPVHTSLVGQF